MPMTPEEQERVAFHLSYPVVGSYDVLRSQGVPISEPVMNELVHALGAIKPASEKLVREQVKVLDCILEKIRQARDAVLLLAADKTRFNPDALAMLWNEYRKERGRLADMLAIDKYHWSYLTTDEEGGYVQEPL